VPFQELFRRLPDVWLAELLPDEHLAMTPSSDVPKREGSRDGPGGCLMCGGP
jgi:hypothetical protein